MSKNYTEYERMLIAKKEYDENLAVGKPVEIGDDGTTIGTVVDVIDQSDNGLHMTVVKEPSGDVTVLFQGSKAPGEKGSWADWVKNDIPMAASILANQRLQNETFDQVNAPYAAQQLVAASRELNKLLDDDKYKGAKFNLYAHSLGSMDAQLSLANVSDPSRIRSAYLYNGPNTYPNLSKEQKAKVDSMKPRIQNYIDPLDVIGLNYPKQGSKNAVGTLHHVASRFATDKVNESFKEAKSPLETLGAAISAPITWFGDQHLWGGYIVNPDGSFKHSLLTEKEARVGQAVGKVQGDLLTYYDHKKALASGGFSSREQLFLDSEQAGIVANNLYNTAYQGYKKIQTIRNEAVAKAEKILASTRDVPFGFILSPSEMEEAYREGGVDRASIVTATEEHFDSKVAQAKEIAKDFEVMKGKLHSGIQKKLNEDKELARKFKEWTSLK